MHKTAAILSYIYLSIPRNTGTAVPTVPASTVGISGYNQKYSKGQNNVGYKFDYQGSVLMRQGHPKGCIGRGGVYSVAGPPACPSKSESLQAGSLAGSGSQAEFVFKFGAERHEPACRSTANALLWLV